MKALNSSILLLLLTGCSTFNDKLYYETVRAISKDMTMIQTACLAAITEISKDVDSTIKLNAFNLSEKCKIEPIKLESPKRNIFGF